jgi:hypothetical protein
VSQPLDLDVAIFLQATLGVGGITRHELPVLATSCTTCIMPINKVSVNWMLVRLRDAVRVCTHTEQVGVVVTVCTVYSGDTKFESLQPLLLPILRLLSVSPVCLAECQGHCLQLYHNRLPPHTSLLSVLTLPDLCR